MVEGVRHLICDVRKSAVQIPHHISRHDPQNTITTLRHVSVARLISFGPLTKIMRAAIDFDNQPCGRNVKISSVRPDRMLPENLEAQLLAAKLAPKRDFRRTQFPSLLASSIYLRFTQRRAPSTIRLSANGPPPRPGEDHELFSNHAPHAAFARSRTRPMYAWRSATLITPRVWSVLKTWLARIACS